MTQRPPQPLMDSWFISFSQQTRQNLLLLLWVVGLNVGSWGMVPCLPALGQTDFRLPGATLERRNQRAVQEAAYGEIQRGEQAQTQGKWSEAIAHWQRALKLYIDGGDRPGMVLVYGYLAPAYLQVQENNAAYDALQKRLNLLRDLGDLGGEIYARNNLGTFFLKGNDFPSAEDQFKAALTIARTNRDLRGAGLSLHNLALSATIQGDHAAAAKLYKTAIGFRKEAKDYLGWLNSLNSLGEVQLILGDYDGAQDSYEQAVTLGENYRQPAQQYRAWAGLVSAYARLDRTDRTFGALNQWIALAQKENNLPQQIEAMAMAASLYYHAGDRPHAVDFYQRALDLAIATGDRDQERQLRQQLNYVLVR